jgi:protein O-mannosyl-transferase
MTAKQGVRISKIADEKPNFSLHILAIVLISTVVFLAYSSSFKGIWALDDLLIDQPLGLRLILEHTGFRKISYLTFALNQIINPNDPLNFRIFNIIIHILNSVLVYVIALITLRSAGDKELSRELCFSAALISATLFALHPLNINAVAYIIQRMASLATFFVLLSIISYILARKAAGTAGKIILYGLCGFCIVLGVLSKENAVMALPLILLYEYIFLSKFDKQIFLKKASLLLAIGVCALLAVSFFIPVHTSFSNVAKLFLNMNEPLAWKGWMSIDVYWSPLQHILTELRVVSRYVFLFFLPLPKFLVFDWWGYPISKGLFDPMATFLSLVFIGGSVVFSVLTVKKFPYLSFGILWYFIAISLESFIAVGADLYFEHRNYLPLTGLCFGIVAQTFIFFRDKLRSRYVVWVIFFLLSTVLGFLTFQRNLIWKDPITFWDDVAQKVPDNPRAVFVIANSYIARSDFRNAETFYRKSIQISADRGSRRYVLESLYRLGFMYIILERPEEAREVMISFERIFGRTFNFIILQGLYNSLNHDYQTAIEKYDEVLKFPVNEMNIRDRATVFSVRGDAYRASGSVNEAMENYKEALELLPSFPSAYHGLAKLEMLKRNYGLAEEYLKKTLVFAPYNFMALSDMANLIVLRGGDLDKARYFAQKAVALNPPVYQPYLIMGTILLASGQDKEAEVSYAGAEQFRAPAYQLAFNKAWAYSLRGDREQQLRYLRELLTLKDVPDTMRETAKRILQRLTK